jgi:xanthine dehydrogenase/oxidase
VKTCPKTGSACAGKCSAAGQISSKDPLKLTFEDDREWHKVSNLKDLFKVMGTIGYRPYILVAGNTAHGVQRRSNDLKVFVDVSEVVELKTHKIDPDSLEIGGNVTLTEAMEIFAKVAKENQSFEYLNEVHKHFDLIANVPVRNAGTIAGNLMLKYADLSFPSDIYVLMEAIGAKVVVCKSHGLEQQAEISSFFLILVSGPTEADECTPMSPSDFINISMRRKVIGKIIFPAFDSSTVFRSYKIMSRAQNALSYVNAAFNLRFNEQKTFVESAKICFGGITDDFTHAEKLAKFLVGKDLYSNEVFKAACDVLSKELKPEEVLPSASPEYRKHLAISLFYKFALNTAPSGKVKESFKSAAELLKRGVSSGVQEIENNEGKSKLYKKVTKIEAEIQCTGETQYVNDIPKFQNELHAAFVLGDKVNGRIVNIDASAALNVKGVVAFFGAKDIPGINNFMPLSFSMFNLSVEEVFCSDKLLYHGQPVGIVVAETFDLAYFARDLVKVEYKFDSVKEPIYPTIKDVVKAKAADRLYDVPGYYLKASEYGNDTKKTISGHFEIPSTQYHYHMETQQCLCVPSEDGMDVYSSSQWNDTMQIAVAEVLKVPVNTINCVVRRVGGAFGGKITRHGHVSCLNFPFPHHTLTFTSSSDGRCGSTRDSHPR